MSTTRKSELYTLIIVFFFWGFVAASNGIFIPFCKAHFNLTQFQSQLIDFTFYGGYFIGSILLFVYSRITQNDLLNKVGYKKGIVIGLIISMLGALAIIPAVHAGSFAFILTAFFVVALGFSLQQTAAQPYAVSLGTADTGAHRLNLAGGINSLGTTIGPVIVSFLLFGKMGGQGNASISSINELYLIMAGLFAAMALFFGITGLKHTQVQSDEVNLDMGALKYPQLTLGMIAIFVYVGVEVSIQSNMGALLQLPEFGGWGEAAISPFISLYWGSLMIGRWTGAVSAFDLSNTGKKIMMALMPLIAFAVVVGVNYLNGNPVSLFYAYLIPVVFMMLMNFIAGENQVQALILFSSFGVLAMLIGLFTTGNIALYAFISGGLACSVLWPCIFSVAINGLGKYTSQASSFLIMMIVGGAIIPPLQGLMADDPNIGIHMSYSIAVLCFLYLVYYGIRAKKILAASGQDLSTKTIGH